MKGINAIENANDPGKDGETGINASFGKDLTAFNKRDGTQLEAMSYQYQYIDSAIN